MLFNSFFFIFLFLPITVIGYFLLNHFKLEKSAKLWLILASFYFYAFFEINYLILIVSSILVNFTIAKSFNFQALSAGFSRKTALVLGILFNIGMLGYFKYYDFFAENINQVLKSNLPILNIILPLGISFFTFQQLSFLIDTFRGKSEKYDFLSYCLFVTFFPQLIAGPIVLPHEMLPQFENHKNKSLNYDNFNRGIFLFVIGFVKKVMIADTVGAFANTGFDKLTSINFCEGWLSSISYTLQLYFDFSGYCDMAMGIALMFNIILPLNFNSPYKSKNFQEFWQKWHMTLGRFMMNYIYVPLGGNRNGEAKTLRNLIIVFVISGIWHGAGWTFIIWGTLHGLAILVHRIWKNFKIRMPGFLGVLLTLFFVNLFWVFFRANNVSDAIKVISAMFDFSTITAGLTEFYTNNVTFFFTKSMTYRIVVLGIILAVWFKNSYEISLNFKSNWKFLLITLILFFVAISHLGKEANFLYFNF